MKIGRFKEEKSGIDNPGFFGIISKDGESVSKISEKDEIFKILEGFTPGVDFIYKISQLKILPPVLPSKIVAIGLNYKDHAVEMNKKLPEEPLIFLKPSSAVIGHLDYIEIPGISKRVDYESELAVVIGKRAKKVKRHEVSHYIIGYTCMNDVTARDLQTKDVQYSRAKGFDTFAPLGPFIETEVKDPGSLAIKGFLNGELKQKSSTSNLIFDISFLVEFISNVMTLLPGDIIATGTPSGIGPLNAGDKFEIEIENVGKLTNYVR